MTGPGINVSYGRTLSHSMMARRRREKAQREADELAERKAKEALHRGMADYWMACGWPLDADDDDA